MPRLLGAEPNAQHHYPCNLSWLTGRNFSRGFQKSFRTCRRAVTLLCLNSPHSRFDFRTSFQTRCRRLQSDRLITCCSTMSASAGTECIFGCASHMCTKRTRVFLIDDDRATRGTGFSVLRNWPPPMRCCSQWCLLMEVCINILRELASSITIWFDEEGHQGALIPTWDEFLNCFDIEKHWNNDSMRQNMVSE